MQTLSLIAAVAANGAIGKEQQLLCYLPNDLKRFKAITLNHTIVMGHNTYKSLPKGALPNRTNVVLSSSPSLTLEGCVVCNTLEEALAQEDALGELFVIGGAQLYRQTLAKAERLYITEIAHAFEDADTFFPSIHKEEWHEVERTEYPADERHPYPYAFVDYERIV